MLFINPVIGNCAAISTKTKHIGTQTVSMENFRPKVKDMSSDKQLKTVIQ